MLRIYDKKFQVMDEYGNIDNSLIPKVILDHEVTVESWHRVELQTRDDFAARYLFSCNGNFRYIMGEIAAYFDVRTKDGKKIAPLHKIFYGLNVNQLYKMQTPHNRKKRFKLLLLGLVLYPCNLFKLLLVFSVGKDSDVYLMRVLKIIFNNHLKNVICISIN